MDIEKLIEQLKDLEACAFGYHINGEVLGMECSDFEQVMVDAANALPCPARRGRVYARAGAQAGCGA